MIILYLQAIIIRTTAVIPRTNNKILKKNLCAKATQHLDNRDNYLNDITINAKLFTFYAEAQLRKKLQRLVART